MYLRDVARLLVTFTDRDPRRTDPTQTTSSACLSGVLAEVKRWKFVLNRHEPFTVDMYMWLLDHINAPNSGHGPDSRYRAVTNWFGKGTYGGYRLQEWAPNVGPRDLNNPVLNIFGDPRAFMLGDLSFRSLHQTRLDSNPERRTSIRPMWAKSLSHYGPRRTVPTTKSAATSVTSTIPNRATSA